MIHNFSVPVPAFPGVGATVDVREVGPARSLVYTSTTTDTVVLEGSSDGSNFAEIVGAWFNGTAAKEITNAVGYVRSRRKTGSGGTISLALSAAPLDSAEDHASFFKGPDATAAETLGRLPFYRANGSRKIRDFAIFFQSAVTGNATNYATILLEAINPDGSAAGAVSTVTTVTSASALVPVDGAADVITELSDGQALTFRVLKAGAGVSLPRFGGVVRFR